ncbi:hypothetical protein VTI74DRAFT_9178 [Chaetomium olivicolor]
MAPSHDSPTPARDARADAEITQAPSADALELRLRTFAKLQARATVPSCASSCINDAVTGLTPCSLDDDACKCRQGNALAIQMGAYNCVIDSCGFITGPAIWSEAAEYCTKVRAGSPSAKTIVTTEAAGGGVVVVTATLGNGQLRTSTVFVSSPTDSSGSGSSGGTGSGSTFNLPSTSSPSSSLSTGAIAGIAVGSAAGVAIICLVAFLIYRYNRKRQAYDAAPTTEPKDTAGPTPPTVAAASAAPAVPIPGQPELDKKPGAFVQPQPVVSPIATPSPIDQRTVSHHPSVVSNVSPAPPQHHLYPPPAGVPELQPNPAWDAQQQQQTQSQPQLQPTPPPGYAVVQAQPPQPQGQGQVQHPGGAGAPHYEMGVMPPELQPNASQFVPELHGQQAYGYRQGLYEMPGSGRD